MKQSDIFSIIIIATVGTLASYFAVNAFLDNPDDAAVSITTIDEISPDLATPDPELFNPDAVNPTVEVMIDGCKDLDQNGLLDYQELVACDKITPEEPQQPDDPGEGTLYPCNDGTLVTDKAQCPENQKQEPEQPQSNQQQDNPQGQTEQQQTEGQ